MLVRELMTVEVMTTTEDTSLTDVVDEMLRYGVSGLPVTTRTREVLGVVTEADVVAKLGFGLQPRRPLRTILDELFRSTTHRWASKAEGGTAGAVMSAPAVTIGPDATVREAANLMVTRSLKRLPVVDGDDRLIGIITQRDLLRTMGHEDHVSSTGADDGAERPPLRHAPAD